MPTLTPSSEDVRIYEWCVLYPYGLPQKDEAELLKDIDALFAEAGAKLVAKDKWGRRGLAYPVKGHTEGNFTIYYFEMDPSRVKEVDQALKIHRNVLRHLSVKPPKGYQIVQYSELYEKWLKERETVGEQRAREQEEKVKERVAEKAKRAAKQTQIDKKKPTEAKPAMQEDVLTEKIDKLISDDTIEL